MICNVLVFSINLVKFFLFVGVLKGECVEGCSNDGEFLYKLYKMIWSDVWFVMLVEFVDKIVGVFIFWLENVFIRKS